MQDHEHAVTISKMTVGVGAGGTVAAKAAEAMSYPTLSDWVAILTIAFLLVQIFFIIYDRMKKRRK